MRRRPDASGQLGSIKDRPHCSQSTASDELASHLRRRSLAIEEVNYSYCTYVVSTLFTLRLAYCN